MLSSSRILASLCIVAALLGCRMNPRRDVGRVQAPIGRGQTEIYPRSELQPGSGGMLAGPVPAFPAGTGPAPPLEVPGPQVAVGPPPGMGASVPFSPPSDNMPMAAITPPPMDSRLSAIPPPAVPAQPAIGIAAAPAAPLMVATPVPAVAPAAMIPLAQAIPVVFPTPTTGSSFIPAGAMAPVGVPGTVVPASPIAGGVSPGALNRLAPTAGPPPGLAAAPTAPSFLSGDAASLNALRLQPRGIAQPMSPSPPPAVPTGPLPVPPAPTTPSPTTPGPAAPLIVPPPDEVDLPPIGPLKP